MLLAFSDFNYVRKYYFGIYMIIIVLGGLLGII